MRTTITIDEIRNKKITEIVDDKGTVTCKEEALTKLEVKK
jgi:hypothetical protein